MPRSRISAVIALYAVLALASIMPAAVAQQRMVTVPSGTDILVRMLDSIDSSKAQAGTRFSAVLETNVSVDGTTIVPAGNTVYGRLAVAEQAGRAYGSSNLQLELTDIVINGTAYPIYTGAFEVKGSSSGKRSAKRLLGGAGIGAIIGGIAGNAGMGAAIGVAAGAVGSVAQKGKSVEVASETLISFRLQQPASLPAPPY
jgi:hypothetical protein